MAGHGYLGWDELDDPDGIEPPAVAGAVPDPPQSERLAALLAERARLTLELDRLLGKAPPSDDEKRENARFPMPIHTAESRLEDRRRANEEARARAAERRALEAAQLRAREEQRAADRKREQEREVIQREVVQRADSTRRRQRTDDTKRARRVAEHVQQQWASQRRAALRLREAARRDELTIFDRRSARMRELAAGATAQRQQERVDVYRRLDDRADRARRRRLGRDAD